MQKSKQQQQTVDEKTASSPISDNNEKIKPSQIKETFNFFDCDGDGIISFNDLKNTFVKIGEKMDDDEIKEIIASVDSKNSGQICVQDFELIMTSTGDSKDNNSSKKNNKLAAIAGKSIIGSGKVVVDINGGAQSQVPDTDDDEKQSLRGNGGDTSKKMPNSEKESSKATSYHEQANTRFVYANPDGYAAVDAGIKGGYLIQAVKKVFCNEKEIYNSNLDSIVNQIREKARDMVGTWTMENVQDVNHMNFDVFFAGSSK